MVKLTKKEAGMIIRHVKERHKEVSYLLDTTGSENLKKIYTKEEKEWRELLKKLENELQC